MANSPYFTGAAPNFGPPGGLAGLIQQDRAIATSGAGGWKDFADVAEKFKKQQDMGKAADYAVKANPDILSKLNIHPDQWKTLGAREKSAALGGYMEAQATQGVLQKFAETAQQMKAREQEMGMRQQDIESTEAFGKTMSEAQGAGERPMTMQDFAAAAARNPKAWTAPAARPLISEMTQASDPSVQFGRETERMRAEAYREQVQNMGKQSEKPNKRSKAVPVMDKYGEPTGQYIQQFESDDPEEVAAWIEKQNKNSGAGGTTGGKPLPADLAKDFLKQAGGDKAKARELARKAGYTF